MGHEIIWQGKKSSSLRWDGDLLRLRWLHQKKCGSTVIVYLWGSRVHLVLIHLPFFRFFLADSVFVWTIGIRHSIQSVYESECSQKLFLASAFHFHAIYLHFQSLILHISKCLRVYNSKRCQQNNSWIFKSLLVMNSWRIRTDFVWMKLTFGFLNLCCKKMFDYGNEPTKYFSSKCFLCLQCIFTSIRLPLIGCSSIAISNIQTPLLVDHII